jgi:glycosyltransferase involved in cell wall biosynthesis
MADSDSVTRESCELSIVMPCLDESETLGTCIDKALHFIARRDVAGEVLVADNGSTDGSVDIARRHGARVVEVADKGYGNALRAGFAAARGRFVIMGDADDSYDFAALDGFLDRLREGYALVMGNRFRGGIEPGAMPPLHRYLGNPVLSGLGNIFFPDTPGDFHCGLRGFDRAAVAALDLRTTGMELASEMVVKASLHGLRMTEVPTRLSPDGRSRAPHLRSWRDGWRHLRFLLVYSPRWLFLYPGAALLLAGAGLMAWLLPGPRTVGGVVFDIHSILYGAAAMILGLQAMSFAVFSRVYAVGAGLVPAGSRLARLAAGFSLEKGLAGGGLILVLGLSGSIAAVLLWGRSSFGDLTPAVMMRLAIPSLTAVVLGAQVVLGSFFLSILRLGERPAVSGKARP